MPRSLCGVAASFSSESNDCVSYGFITVLIFRAVGSVGAPAPDAAAAVTAVVMADVLALRKGWMAGGGIVSSPLASPLSLSPSVRVLAMVRRMDGLFGRSAF